MNKIWTDDEREYVRANAGVMMDNAIAAALTRITGRPVSLNAVRRQRQKMGLRKKQGRGVCGLEGPTNSVQFSPKRPFGIPLTIRATPLEYPPAEGPPDAE